MNEPAETFSARRLAVLVCAFLLLPSLQAACGGESEERQSEGADEETARSAYVEGTLDAAPAPSPKELVPGFVRWEMGCPFPFRAQHPESWTPIPTETPSSQQRSVNALDDRTFYLRGYGTMGMSQLDYEKRTFVGGDDSVGTVSVAGEGVTVFGRGADGIDSRTTYRLFPPGLRMGGKTVRWMALEAGLEGPGDAIVPHDTVMMILRSLEFVDC